MIEYIFEVEEYIIDFDYRRYIQLVCVWQKAFDAS